MSNELGTLVIVVIEGRHLIDNHSFYKQDPYVKLSLSGATKQTPVDPKGGQHPVWDVELRFPISEDPAKSNRTLTISVFSKERRDDELLGEGTVDITDTLKSGEFDDWVPLSLKGTQRGEVFLEMTFFAAGPAPLNRRSYTNPAERLARPQQPRRLVSLPLLSDLAPGGQAQRANSNDGSRQRHPKVQQVPLPGAWPGPSGQRRQSTESSTSSLPDSNRRSSKNEDTPLPPLPPDATPPKEEFVPSILRLGGPSRTSVDRAPSPPIANDTEGHHHTIPNDLGANTTHPRHHTSQPQLQPPTQPHSPYLASYSTQGSLEYVGGYSQGGHATTQPFPQAQPEVSHTQYHSQPYPPSQQHQQIQHSPWQQSQPQGGPPSHGSPNPTDNHPAQRDVPPGPQSPGNVASQTPSPSVPSHITAQSPPPVSHARPYAANTNSVPLSQSHVPPTGSVLSPPPQYATPSPHAPPYTSPLNLSLSLPTSPPPPFFLVPQSPAYFEPVTPTPFSPPTEPELQDPYLFRRHQSPFSLPPRAPQPLHTNPDTGPEPTIPPLAAAASSSTQQGRGVTGNEDERAARELQRQEVESARARREQEERDEELARILVLEQEESARARREQEESTRARREQEGRDEELAWTLVREQEESARAHREEEENARARREEEENARARREEEENVRARREEENARVRREQKERDEEVAWALFLEQGESARARREQEENARREQEENARREQEENARREQEENAHREQEQEESARARREQEERDEDLAWAVSLELNGGIEEPEPNGGAQEEPGRPSRSKLLRLFRRKKQKE